MKRILTITSFTALALSTLAQLPRIVVQGSGAPQVHTDITAAVAAAQSGDHVHLSGGNFGGPLLVVDKTLHFVGAGIHPDSTGATGISTIGQQVRITTAAAGSSFTGLIFGNDLQYGTTTDGANDDPTNIVFQRCEFRNLVQVNATPAPPTSSSTVFDECIFRAALQCTSNSGTTETVTRCIFAGVGAWPNGLSNLNVHNSAFIYNGVGVGLSLGQYENCVFAIDLTSASGPSTFQHCIFSTGGLPAGSTGSGNLFGLAANAIYANETNSLYTFDDDLHLAAGSPGAGAGTDGTDIGLYGSLTPYKPGAVPVNPHYRVANIANATDANGQLPVTIKVAAQAN